MSDPHEELQELKETLSRIGPAFQDFKSHHVQRLDDIERKLNLQRVGGVAADPNQPDPRDVFERSVKSFYPNREPVAQDFDYELYRKSFGRYLRQGIEVLSHEERKAMQVGIDSDGGFLAPTEFAREVIRFEHASSVMRGISRVLPMGMGDIEFPASLTRPEVGWVGENGSRTETDSPTIGKFRLESKEIYCAPKATQKLIDDSVLNIESFMAEEIGMAIGEEEDAQFITGNGILTPRGLTTYPTAATTDAAGTRPWGTIEHIATGVAGDWPTTDEAIYDKLIDITQALRPRYRQRARWLLSTEAVTKIRKIKDDNNHPLWQPSMSESQPATLLGFPVSESERMPAVGANSLSVAFGDFRRAYWIGDRFGIRVLRDPYTDKPHVIFYSTKRTSGGVADSSALKLLKFATT